MSDNFLKVFLPFLFLIKLSDGFSQTPDFMLQGWYWDYPQVVDGKNYMWNLALKADALKEAGFTYVWLPPIAKGTGGNYSMGYDIRDYYDIGNYGFARWGNANHYDTLVNYFDAAGLKIVADVIFNHRDGGKWEDNPSVEGWIENMNATKIGAGDQPFPSDRFQCYILLGGASGNGAGTYYFKIHSASGASVFYSKPYNIITWTNIVDPDYFTPPVAETEPNGGGDCGEINNTITLGKRRSATIDAGGCGTDEFALTISSGNFNASGDTLWIKMYNTGAGGLGDMSDHFIYGLWSGALAADIQDQIHYQTATDFTNLPSGLGQMDHSNFKPNGSPTQLSGDLDAMYFYYDIDQYALSTQDVLFNWSKWLWEEKDVRGFRMDAVKHFPAWFTADMLDFLHDNTIDPGMVVGENYDYTPSVLKGWIDDVMNNMDADTKDAIDVRVFDFALRNNLEQACDGFGYDVRNVFNSGIVDGAGGNGFNVVTFINNHDFRDAGQPVDNNPELGYAYIMTNNKLGIPCIYYSDYYAPNNLQYKINGLMEVHKKYIYGATFVDYLSRFSSPYPANYISAGANTSLIYQLSYSVSGREVIVAINFSGSTLKVDQTINTANIFPGDTLTDIFSQTAYEFITVQDDNQIYLEIPPRSFAVFVEGDLRNELIDITTPVAIDDQILPAQISVFPNPTSDLIYFNAENDIVEKIELYDITGNLVLQINAPFENNINIQNYAAGIYFIKIETRNQIYQTKIIKF